MAEKVLIILFGLIMISCMESENFMEIEEVMEEEETKEKISYLALGDSYTIGQSVSESERFPVIIADSLSSKYGLETDLKIIATTGWRTDDLLNAMDRENPESRKYDFISLLIGVNNQYQGKPIAQYKAELEVLINRSIELLEGNSQKLILVSIPDYGVTPFAANRDPQKIAQEIDAYNTIKQEFAEKYSTKYVFITDLTRAAKSDLSLLATDELHPSGKSYAQWVRRIFPIVEEILKL
jgi:lysophospholipase L1-like esterase